MQNHDCRQKHTLKVSTLILGYSALKEIKKFSNMFVSADKTTNLYELQVPHYRKLLNENITSTYKKTGKEPLNHINTDAQAIARDLKLDDRIES